MHVLCVDVIPEELNDGSISDEWDADITQEDESKLIVHSRVRIATICP